MSERIRKESDRRSRVERCCRNRGSMCTEWIPTERTSDEEAAATWALRDFVELRRVGRSHRGELGLHKDLREVVSPVEEDPKRGTPLEKTLILLLKIVVHLGEVTESDPMGDVTELRRRTREKRRNCARESSRLYRCGQERCSRSRSSPSGHGRERGRCRRGEHPSP